MKLHLTVASDDGSFLLHLRTSSRVVVGTVAILTVVALVAWRLLH